MAMQGLTHDLFQIVRHPRDRPKHGGRTKPEVGDERPAADKAPDRWACSSPMFGTVSLDMMVDDARFSWHKPLGVPPDAAPHEVGCAVRRLARRYAADQ